MSINLLPRELAYERKKHSTKRLLIMLVLFYLCFFLFSNGALYIRIRDLEQEQSYWHWLQSETSSIRSRLETLEQDLTMINREKTALEAVLQNSFRYSDILSLIQRLLPAGLRVSQLIVSEERWLILSGEADAMGKLGQLVSALESNPVFQDVTLKGLHLHQSPDKHTFSIELTLKTDQVTNHDF